MKTNYNQWVAWYELSIKPHVITPHTQLTRCGYATLKRPPKPFETMTIEQNDQPQKLSNPRKRPRIEYELESIETSSLKAEKIIGKDQEIVEDDDDSDYSDAPDFDQFLQDCLKKIFNCSDWIPNQLESIRSALDNKTLLIVMPLGKPRNLCYQLPAALSLGATLVLIPQLSYIEHHLITTCFFFDHPLKRLSYIVSVDDLLEKIKNSRLIYVTYSHFFKYRALFARHQKHIDRIVLDEAHLLSRWDAKGHPRYRKAVEALSDDFPQIPITALTAIPNERIELDIIRLLNQHVEVYKKSIFL
ncbi:hypothetical protein G6F56_003317 [Rhizopus delemar]|nr:hypothetical protein G6F56_003317 [Rhizopus delemar]